MFKIKTKYLELYRARFILVITDSNDELKKYIPSSDCNTIYAHSWNYSYKRKDAYYIILNPINQYRKITHGVIAHEAIHCVHMLFENRGFNPTFENDEHITYLVEWIVDFVYNQLDKLKIKVYIK